ncbi:Asp-tRNA(Asn)/Glu-tRNA(Gln) amidotransferase subunit GatC [Alkaliphilus transvaalensis]|uniref:Asp-tRNA(Asn)/Glu-tRNA(Gln) amidotransferase subunit GatC n=1 Tax=Alkaliphilus transvaalensis TaxID=114628 RepID=UPI00047C906F|nr:Asp-tRNA(Asn)/Glu-tRNA(Gln) amidotransferase subunit GatC [Alkaliphilus transvaalensis]
MRISVEEVQHIAKLAKLRFSTEEAEKMATEFDSILGHFQSMDQIELNLDGSRDTNVVEAPLREDKASVFGDQNKLFKNAKKLQEGYIQVPKIIE